MASMAALVEFGLLGPLVVRFGNTAVPVQRGHQRTLLATLLLDADHAVPVDTIAAMLWGDEPPPSALVSIRNYVRRLRQALGAAGQRIITEPRGYLVRAGHDELDVPRFESLLSAARAAARSGGWPRAEEQARQALELWRGEPLADIESEFLQLRVAPRLGELRLQALETHIEAGLHLGSHAELAIELARLVADHPLREHLHELLMLALYRSGRQADALHAYQQVRTILAEELGAEPGAELKRLHRQILTAHPALAWPPPTPLHGSAAPAVPRQLPAAVPHFTGRAAELAALTGILDADSEDLPTVVIGGTAGVGKTALAIHWARQVVDRFPGGQLHLNLRGFDPSADPVAPAQVIRGLLDALGVPPASVPAGLDAQAGLYRSLLAGRRMLIVLDNARDEQQVRPLLPGSPGSLVLITSRSQLGGLAATDGARLLTLDVFTAAEARQMLGRSIGGSRVTADLAVLDEIVSLCACMPLALAVTAARAAARPRFPLAALAAELRDVRNRLSALSTGEEATDIRAVFSWSCQQLSPAAGRMFRLLALHPGPDITAPAAASLAGLDLSQAGAQLRELTRHSLLAEHVPGRYLFHDLLRVYATEQAKVADPGGERRAAVGRVLDHYLHTAHAAAKLLNPTAGWAVPQPPAPAVTPERLVGHAQAMTWFGAEHKVLLLAVTLAAGEGFDAHAWLLPGAMADYLDWQGYWADWAAAQQTAVAAADRLGDATGQAAARRLLAHTYARAGDYDLAREQLTDCIGRYRELDDLAGQARAHQSLCYMAWQQGRAADAVSHAEQALALFRAAGDLASQAVALNNVGCCHILFGLPQQARAVCAQSLALHRELGNHYGEAIAWDSLGGAEHQLGHLAAAARCYRRAIGLFRELGGRLLEAASLGGLGDVRLAAGQPGQACEEWTKALDILEDLGHPDADLVRGKLAQLTARAPAPRQHRPGPPGRAALATGQPANR
jgi:DNA-binding SARP family transcriptional activator/tetratricopeptide (TPR) repeat protein